VPCGVRPVKFDVSDILHQRTLPGPPMCMYQLVYISVARRAEACRLSPMVSE